MADDALPGTDELSETQRALGAARAEIDQWKRAAETAEARAQAAVADAERLTLDLTTANEATTAHQAEIASLRQALDASHAQVRDAASRYRDLVVRNEPSLPPDLIAGDTVDDVDASLTAARSVAERVREHAETRAQAASMPAGAPPRSGPDLRALTPEQKISYGLAQRA